MPTGSDHSPRRKITVTINSDLREKLERQTEEYYLSFSGARRKEDKEWSKIAARSAKDLWR